MSNDRRAADFVGEHFDDLVKGIVSRHFQLHPGLSERYGVAGRSKCLEDTRYHLCYLLEAMSTEPSIFSSYIVWVDDVLSHRGIPTSDLRIHLEQMSQVLKENVPEDVFMIAANCIADAFRKLEGPKTRTPSYLSNVGPFADLARRYFDLVTAFRREDALALLLTAARGGVAVGAIYRHVLEPCQREIGRLWQINEISTAEEHYCTAAAEVVMAQLCRLVTVRTSRQRRVLVSSVQGENHDIGARMVSDFLDADGWQTLFLGANTPHQALAHAIVAMNVDVLALSVTTAINIESASDAIVAARKSVPFMMVMVGGAAFNDLPNLWEHVGADGYATDASAALSVAESLLIGNGGQRSIA